MIPYEHGSARAISAWACGTNRNESRMGEGFSRDLEELGHVGQLSAEPAGQVGGLGGETVEAGGEARESGGREAAISSPYSGQEGAGDSELPGDLLEGVSAQLERPADLEGLGLLLRGGYPRRAASRGREMALHNPGSRSRRF
jgi:hypothetical protein